MYTMTVIWEKQRERVETAATCLPALATIFDTLGIRNISLPILSKIQYSKYELLENASPL